MQIRLVKPIGTQYPGSHSIMDKEPYLGAQKQNIVALSSTELEYITLTHAAKEAIWLRTFINEVVGVEQAFP